jgi:L-fuconolactonase
MQIDSHQHFWKYNPIRDSWMDESMKSIRRDFLPEDLVPILKSNNIDGCVAVQADQSEEETVFLLDLASKNEEIKGVVGWLDLRADNIEDRLDHFSKFKKLKAIRHIVQSESEDFMQGEAFQYGISKLHKYNLVYDILIFPNQLESAIQLVQKFPEVQFVLDHVAKPNIKSGEIVGWKENIITLASFSNVTCKLSGMFTEANWQDWELEEFIPYLDVVSAAFGTDRLLYGSDWPVCTLATSYKEQVGFLRSYIAKFTKEEQRKIMGKNAIRVYNLND